MTTADDLLLAIVTDPEDIGVRLVYADWLEENGQVERSEFIRVQTDIDRICEGNRRGKPETDATSLSSLISRESGLMWGVWNAGWMDPVPRAWLSDSVINRGFVESISCTCSAWLEHGPAIVRQHPVTKVVLTDKRPYGSDNYDPGWAWAVEEGSDSPPWRLPEVLVSLFDHRPPRFLYRSKSLALDALSAACIVYARAKAKLPSLATIQSK
jgi:uncharacterized protein (TIGR02996 family)